MNEKTSPWFKVFALCTALGLGGTYVWKQQQKATPQIEKTTERTVLSSSKSLVIDPAVLPVDEEKTSPPAIPQEPEVEERVLMPGSKSGRVLPTPEAPVAPKQRTVLPSSKSMSPILDPPKANEP